MKEQFKKMEANEVSHSSDLVVNVTSKTTYLNRAEVGSGTTSAAKVP